MSSAHSAGYVLHANGDPLTLLPAVRRALAELDPTVALARAERLDDVLRRARAPLAFTMLLLVMAATVALLLGMVGVYAVISYAVAQRRGEIGLRLALCAQPAEVTAMIMRQSGTVILAGVLTGVIAAAGSARVLQALLFGVAWNHAATYAAAAQVVARAALRAGSAGRGRDLPDAGGPAYTERSSRSAAARLHPESGHCLHTAR